MVSLLEALLDKRELRGVNREFARKLLNKHLGNKQGFEERFLKDPERVMRGKEYLEIKRAFRADMRILYGVFFMPGYPAKREKLVGNLIKEPTTINAQAVLGLHRSTYERLPYYDYLYQQLFRFTGIPESILDLGCGYNPFSYQFLNARPAYHSADIAQEDLGFINRYFTSLGVEHSEHCLDLSDPKAVKNLPRADVAFAFKLLDGLEAINRDVTKELLQAIPAEHIIISFASLSIGQHKTINPREWFERLITDQVVGRVTLPNEQFVIITKQG